MEEQVCFSFCLCDSAHTFMAGSQSSTPIILSSFPPHFFLFICYFFSSLLAPIPSMATDHNPPPTRDSNNNTQLLDELQALSQSLYQTHTSATRRTASLALPRSELPSIPTPEDVAIHGLNKPRSRRMSLSPWRSRPKLNDDDDNKLQSQPARASSNNPDPAPSEKKGIWNWKPIRALSHIGMSKMSCLFSVEVVTLQGLPASMNGLRLSVCVRKKETRDGAVNTMPSRVSQGAADFEETLFLKCHVYYTPAANGKPLKFEPRPFWIYAFAVDAQELDFGRSIVDLSKLIEESMDKSYQGTRVRQWDISFNLGGKAKGGELLLKLGFQIMEKDGGIGIYNQPVPKESKLGKSFGRKQSKTSFSVLSPRLTSQSEAWTPSLTRASTDLPGMDELDLDEPAAPIPSTSPSVQKSEEAKIEDLDIPDFEVVDKGIEIQDKEEESEKSVEEKSTSSEVVKEVVLDQAHLNRLSELDSIAQQIKALESMMGDESLGKTDEESDSQKLDADEENVTMEFLQMLEQEDGDEPYKLNYTEIPHLALEETEDSSEVESKSYLSDLGKGLGCIVQTRDGGYLAAMNPLNIQVSRKDTPKLAMQISKPFILASTQSVTGFELFQRMACIGVEELSSKVMALMCTDDLQGKTAEQIAFEGIASAIIQGRNKEGGGSSTAARAIAAVKSMASAMSTGRKERISTGIWNLNESPVSVEEIVAMSMQKLEEMSVEALKVQAEMAEEEAPFEVSGVNVKSGGKDEKERHPLDCAVPLEDWMMKEKEDGENMTVVVVVVVQLRDPLRGYEVVGGPVVGVIHAEPEEMKMVEKSSSKYEEERRFKVRSLHVGGLKVRMMGGGKRNVWDSEKQRLTAMQWLLAYGIGKAVKKGKHLSSKGPDLLWSLSSRVMADMWLKPIRNPDVKFVN